MTAGPVAFGHVGPTVSESKIRIRAHTPPVGTRALCAGHPHSLARFAPGAQRLLKVRRSRSCVQRAHRRTFLTQLAAISRNHQTKTTKQTKHEETGKPTWRGPLRSAKGRRSGALLRMPEKI